MICFFRDFVVYRYPLFNLSSAFVHFAFSYVDSLVRFGTACTQYKVVTLAMSLLIKRFLSWFVVIIQIWSRIQTIAQRGTNPQTRQLSNKCGKCKSTHSLAKHIELTHLLEV